MDIFYELLYFMRDGTEGTRVSELLGKYGRKTVRQAAVTLLHWLRHYEDRAEQPLELKPERQLDRLVYGVMAAGEMSDALELKGHQVNFRTDIPLETRRKIAAFVAANHRPEDKLMDL